MWNTTFLKRNTQASPVHCLQAQGLPTDLLSLIQEPMLLYSRQRLLDITIPLRPSFDTEHDSEQNNPMP